ncbi:unnamed protein product [Blepharisma stoltei]|uniref:Uncharacterized protein n=1 Tax=Blepharisma stoltei TaxID=1481888 RepID=A0AAU9IVD0_9CILI|nr:unnamed protein product [Blepharisma stoltei]
MSGWMTGIRKLADNLGVSESHQNQEIDDLRRQLSHSEEKYMKLKEEYSQLLFKLQNSGQGNALESLELAYKRLQKQINELNVLVSFERSSMYKEFEKKELEILKKHEECEIRQRQLDMENEKIKEKYMMLGLSEENLENSELIKRNIELQLQLDEANEKIRKISNENTNLKISVSNMKNKIIDEVKPNLIRISVDVKNLRREASEELRIFGEYFTSQMNRVATEAKFLQDSLQEAENSKKQNQYLSRSLTKPEERTLENQPKRFFNQFPKKKTPVAQKTEDIDLEEILGSSIPKSMS